MDDDEEFPDHIESRIMEANDRETADMKEIKSALEEDFLFSVSTVLRIGYNFRIPKYTELMLKLADVIQKIDVSRLITEEFVMFIDILIEGIGKPGEHQKSNLDVIYAFCEYQCSDFGELLVSRGIINVLIELLESNDTPVEFVSVVINIFACLAHINRKMSNCVQNKFKIDYCFSIFTQCDNEEVRISCSKFFSSVSRFPLSDSEIDVIFQAFNIVVENGITDMFNNMSDAASRICGRKGKTYDIVNRHNIIENLIEIKDYSDETTVNMLNGIALASKDEKIVFAFDVAIVLDELDSENVSVASAAANCIMALVQNRDVFLQTFNIYAFLTDLIDLFNRSAFNSRKYVAEAILNLANFVHGKDLVTAAKNGLIECICFIMKISIDQSKPDLITFRRCIELICTIFDDSKIQNDFRSVINIFDDEEGFQYICDVFDEFSDHSLMRGDLSIFLDGFMEDFAPENYRNDE